MKWSIPGLNEPGASYTKKRRKYTKGLKRYAKRIQEPNGKTWDDLGIQTNNVKKNILYDPAIPLLGVYTKAKNFVSKSCLYSHVHCSILHNSQGKETT